MWKIKLIQMIILYCCLGFFALRGDIAATIMTSTFILTSYLEERRCEMSYKNKEGYPDPTEGKQSGGLVGCLHISITTIAYSII